MTAQRYSIKDTAKDIKISKSTEMKTTISKVLRARADVFVKAYREKTTSRFARSKASALTGDVNFRTSLKIIHP